MGFIFSELSVKKIENRKKREKSRDVREYKRIKTAGGKIQPKKTQQLEDWCVREKNLYNIATYTVRLKFFKKKRWMQYTELYHTIKKHDRFPPIYLILFRYSFALCWSSTDVKVIPSSCPLISLIGSSGIFNFFKSVEYS